MKTLVELEFDDFVLMISASGIEDSQRIYSNTLSKIDENTEKSCITFTPPIKLKNMEMLHSYNIPGNLPVFFENRSYDIEFIFDPTLLPQEKEFQAKLEHRLHTVERNFKFNKRTRSLRGTFNSRNEIGDSEFSIYYTKNGVKHSQILSFRFLPVKIHLESHLIKMYFDIDNMFPLWRYQLTSRTSLNADNERQKKKYFSLFWLSQYEQIEAKYLQAVELVLRSPHSKMVQLEKTIRAEKLRERINANKEDKIKESLLINGAQTKIRISKKYLSNDTPENRFVKTTLRICKSRLSSVRAAIVESQETQKNKYSDTYSNQFQESITRLTAMINNPTLKELSDFRDIHFQSQVMQNKLGYSKVYYYWQQLKIMLNGLDNGKLKLSVRPVNEIYEIWCFVKLVSIIEQLGFTRKHHTAHRLRSTPLGKELKDGFQGSFDFKNNEGVLVSLIHEPRFSRFGSKIRSAYTTQQPDIYMIVSLPDGLSYSIIFDAKYRIKSASNDEYGDGFNQDLVPDDAINQLHRYRDSLLSRENGSGLVHHFHKPVIGAFALYPGNHERPQDNPYYESINTAGIGAFCLLPTDDDNISLVNYLRDRLVVSNSNLPGSLSDRYFTDNAVRTGYAGTNILRYLDLTLVASQLGPNRSTAYLSAFENGEARDYHTKVLATDRERIQGYIVREIKYLTVAVGNKNGRQISYIYPVKSVRSVKRNQLSELQTGISVDKNKTEAYWHFELENAVQIRVSIHIEPLTHFELLLIRLPDLLNAEDWASLKNMTTYKSLLDVVA